MKIKLTYRLRFFRLCVFLMLVPFLAYSHGSFGIYLSDNMFSMASTRESKLLVMQIPHHPMWCYGSAGIGILGACSWLADELFGLASRKRG